MRMFSLEHSKAAYVADFAFYGLVILSLSGSVWWMAPQGQGGAIVTIIAAGVLMWTVMEYLLHRFVLHGVQPFCDWHAEHHQRPTALICTPTVLSAPLIGLLVFLPSWWAVGLWMACCFTLGVVMGYQAYATTHHAIHHWRSDNAWLRRRKSWHALHHHVNRRSACYGVTTDVWDRTFRSD
jgi:sterol desaturase/sphingolipid hydroxylase (fatty acid hydroxylase superfamily)